ncbi:unnamed protein product [Bubo scandiacus]
MPCKQLWVRSSREIDTSEMPECIARMTRAAQLPSTEMLKRHYYEHIGILREIVEVIKEKSLPDHEKIKS